jgi:hypothetical protein
MHRNPVRRSLVLRPEEWLWAASDITPMANAGPIPVNEIRRAELRIRKIF